MRTAASDISMMNIFFLLEALLLVDGVFGVDETVSLSVIKGDSVTLKPHTAIPEDDTAQWWFGDLIIAQMNKAAGLFSTSEGDKVGFKDRLNLDKQTGYLTITNIRTNHTGDYNLKIKSTVEKSKIFSVTVHDAMKSLSVMEGDTVTLHTGVTDIQRGQIQWKSGGVPIADLNEDLTIRNIQRDQSGDYELEINTTSMILHRKLHITVSDEMKKVSVKEGESVTLNTGVTEIQGYDLFWMFGDDVIGNINKETKHTYDSKDTRFNGRLQPIGKSGDLTISDSKPADSGVYHLNMSSSSHTVQRNITVTVKAIDHSMPIWKKIVIGAVIGIVIAIVFAIVFRIVTKSWPCRKKTLDPVPSGDMDLLESNLNKESDTRNTH